MPPPRSHSLQQKRAQENDEFYTTVPVDTLLLVLKSSNPSSIDSATLQRYCNATDPATCPLWLEIREHALRVAAVEPLLGSYLYSTVLNHKTLSKALSFHLAEKLGDGAFHCMQWHALFDEIFDSMDPCMRLRLAIRDDLLAIRSRDAACKSVLDAFLYYKGFLGLTTYRMAHALWQAGREDLARLLQARISTVFSMDIHPACQLGSGIMFDHASGVVIGETAVVGDGCSFLHNVTLGGTGKQGGDRHPKLGNNVSVGAGVSILGNIRVGANAKIGAGSVVLREVPEGATVVGIPARVVMPKVPSELSNASMEEGGEGGRGEEEARQGNGAEGAGRGNGADEAPAGERGDGFAAAVPSTV